MHLFQLLLEKVIELVASKWFIIELLFGIFDIVVDGFNQRIHRIEIHLRPQIAADTQLQLFAIKVIIEFVNDVCFLLRGN